MNTHTLWDYRDFIPDSIHSSESESDYYSISDDLYTMPHDITSLIVSYVIGNKQHARYMRVLHEMTVLFHATSLFDYITTYTKYYRSRSIYDPLMPGYTFWNGISNLEILNSKI